MATEIERKFLLPILPADAADLPAEPIAQGYLASSPEGTEVRVRRKGEHCYLTVKHGGSRRRVEVELPLDQADFDQLWPLTAGRQLRKNRRKLPLDGGLTLEIDTYEDALAGLRVAEVEFTDEAACDAFQPPAWLGREISGDPDYRNATLVRTGLPPGHQTAE